ncbi:MAG: energy-coupling factor transporter transmembrane protein EcfT [Coriobacteriales bacterium]|nr:energy-coupling factor transporter transmembrane protein EcfT [Coriobacteriales bacterium]
MSQENRPPGSFEALHPVPGFAFFGLVVLLTVLYMHPVMLGVSFCCAAAWALYLRRGRALRFILTLLLPVMLLAAVLNPAFNHRGVTILFYLFTGNPVTAESLYYGVAGALMIGAVLLWFYCYNLVMPSDKLLWLLGRAVPTLALVLSMALRLVPHYTAQAKRVAAARAGLGLGRTAASVVARAREGLSILSVVTTWALESAVGTADSMASRGFGTGRRTAYSTYHMTRRSWLALAFLVLAGAACVVFFATGAVSVAYFPRFELGGAPLAQAALCVIWCALCAFPLVLDLAEEVSWRSSRLRI